MYDSSTSLASKDPGGGSYTPTLTAIPRPGQLGPKISMFVSPLHHGLPRLHRSQDPMHNSGKAEIACLPIEGMQFSIGFLCKGVLDA